MAEAAPGIAPPPRRALGEWPKSARFLAEKGEGVHHIGVAAPSFDETVAVRAEKGNGVVLSGEFSGISVAYLATGRELGVITEIFSGKPGADLKPDATYPDVPRDETWLRKHNSRLSLLAKRNPIKF